MTMKVNATIVQLDSKTFIVEGVMRAEPIVLQPRDGGWGADDEPARMWSSLSLAVGAAVKRVGGFVGVDGE